MSKWQDMIRAAAGRTAPHVVRTPVMVSAVLLPGRSVALKLEQMQHTGSFKARGAFNNLLARKVPAAGVVAASGGNHGAAVAHAARALGHKARIYVPEIAGPAKIALIRSTGADLQVVPGAYADALEAALTHEAETGAIQLHAYDSPETVAGQGTLAIEWLEQGLEADTVLIAVGGGGLIAGAIAGFGEHVRVVAVEPELAPSLAAARKAGAPTLITPSGVAANSLGAARVGSICFDLAEAADTSCVLVAEDAITDAQALLWRAHRQLVEPGGATALAALTSGAYRPEADERVAVLVCGGNIAPDPLAG